MEFSIETGSSVQESSFLVSSRISNPSLFPSLKIPGWTEIAKKICTEEEMKKVPLFCFLPLCESWNLPFLLSCNFKVESNRHHLIPEENESK